MKNSKPVLKWLYTGLFMTLVMLVIGGVTRLTGSGLSMVEWNLFMGAIPPLSDAEWQATFEAYQQHAEYKLINASMTLEEFKSIFFWEYFHRLWGRLLGFVFLVPFVYFWYTKRLVGNMFYKVGFLFILGGLQGAVGWIMVLSGLGDEPHVSHYKLTLHFMTAMLLITYIVWLIKLYSNQVKSPLDKGAFIKAYKWLGAFFIVLIIQLIYGGFMAGKKASLFYPTFPDMNGQWFPDNAFLQSPKWINFFENVTTIHVIHRSLPVVLLLFLGVFLVYLNRAKVKDAIMNKLRASIVVIIVIQIILGALTLVFTDGKVPVFWAELHQIFGVLLFITTFYGWLQMKSTIKKIQDA